MFPIAVVLVIFGYTCVYVGLANGQSGGEGPTVWEALGWGESPDFENPGGFKSYGRKLPTANPQVTPSFTQV